ncbi:hypothetical protein [Aeromonas hydrophila]|uniref:hypothetical protein n=1 Tax=Aeromonas hydrophila TaxID=644 RepID=UPI00259DC993|nr:hypothetical protein [Aeromonas hydrophila]MDM5119961.1 hypothetical protein [Aeromonas hydrophila]
MNIVTQQFTKEQYKALYEAQQLGVRFDCWLLAPGQRINTQVPLADETKLVSPQLTKCHLDIRVPKNTDYEFDDKLQKIMVNTNESIRDIIANHNNNK